MISTHVYAFPFEGKLPIMVRREKFAKWQIYLYVYMYIYKDIEIIPKSKSDFVILSSLSLFIFSSLFKVHALSRCIHGREFFWHALCHSLQEHLRVCRDRYLDLACCLYDRAAILFCLVRSPCMLFYLLTND